LLAGRTTGTWKAVGAATALEGVCSMYKEVVPASAYNVSR
jgi:hypothetical protein